jgi:hypothetical protein
MKLKMITAMLAFAIAPTVSIADQTVYRLLDEKGHRVQASECINEDESIRCTLTLVSDLPNTYCCYYGITGLKIDTEEGCKQVNGRIGKRAVRESECPKP